MDIFKRKAIKSFIITVTVKAESVLDFIAVAFSSKFISGKTSLLVQLY